MTRHSIRLRHRVRWNKAAARRFRSARSLRRERTAQCLLLVLFVVGSVTIPASTTELEQPTSTPHTPMLEGSFEPCGETSSTTKYSRTEPHKMTGDDFDGPLTITTGGTYTGSWQSSAPDVAAITIRTDEPVVIAGSRLRSRGPLIEATVDGVDLRVTDTVAAARNPAQRGEAPGRFLKLRNVSRLLVDHNDLTGTSGIRLEGYSGDRDDAAGTETVRIVRNSVTNIDGRRSTGSGYQPHDSDAALVQFVQLVRLRSVPSIEIAWNYVHNEPGHSRVEDVVNVYMSSGTPDSPVSIHDNFINGAYPTSPATDEYTGGGIMMGDGGNGGVPPAHVVSMRNVVLNTTNYGVGVAVGNDMTIANNCVLSSGKLPDGVPIAAQNVGIYVWNPYGSDGPHNIGVIDNVVRWQNYTNEGRRDLWLPAAGRVTANTSYDSAVTPAVVDRMYSTWRSRAHEQGVAIGTRG